MKGKRAKKADGGTGGTDDAEMDLKDKPADRTMPSGPSKEAEELKKGGRAKHFAGGRAARKHGGKTEVGEVKGEMAKMHAGRAPRKSGGRTGSDMNPFSSARRGTPAPGRKEMAESEG